MHLVEQHRRDAGQFGIGLDARDEDALGHHRHARRRRALAVHPRGVAEGPADRLARQRRHPLGGGARGEAAGGEQQDLAGAPGSPSSAGATAVVLPAPGGATSTAFDRSRERREQVGQDGMDGKIGH